MPESGHVPLLPGAGGKFFSAGGRKLWLKGVAYGTFSPDESGVQFPAQGRVESDFAAMAAAGVNTVRTYTIPPRRLLDEAARHGLRLLVGVPWEQHVTFLSDRELARSIEQRVREGVRACAGHPALLGCVVGNEIAAPIVRWYGRGRVESFLRRLYEAAKDEHPEGLVTYVNFPSTEYLDLPFLDFLAFNVFLEDPDVLSRYLARLQNLAGDRPLVVSELGLDSRRHGRQRQAELLDRQVRAVFAAGCAGAVLFSWTDEWYVAHLSERGGGEPVEDWDFGLVDRERRPKPALGAARRAFAAAPLPRTRRHPRVSVVVCSRNGAATIRRTCEGLAGLDYPDYEVIVVDDGSVDATAAVAREFGFRVIRTESRGLSSARNTGLAAATGEYVAYIDDDAWPDRDWLRFLVHSFETTGAAAVGGPNIPPPDERATALAVAHAPGGPVHVLLDDSRAEHLPGCNLAVRRSVLRENGGFDPRFRVAGDDVDLCWRLLEAGETIVYSPGAMVWHRRRGSIRAYLRQQRGYGRAEALLEQKWPEKYNAAGHRTWEGRIYGDAAPRSLGRRRWRVYYGLWCSGLFQRVYRSPPTLAGSLRLTPEWWLLLLALAVLAALSLTWRPLFLAVPLLAAGVALSVAEAVTYSVRSWVGRRPALGLRATTAALYLVQPIARLIGRLGCGLTPWRRPRDVAFALPVPRQVRVWSEEWRPPGEWLRALERRLAGRGVAALRGGDYDRWDLRVRGGMLACARLRHVIEEHGAGQQLARFRVAPSLGRSALAVIAGLGALGAAAAADGAGLAAAAILGLTSLTTALAVREAGWACGALLDAAASEAADAEPEEQDLEAALFAVAEARAPRLATASEERV